MFNGYKIWFISDTHRRHKELPIPNVDMVIFCGDESNHYNAAINMNEALDFFQWFRGLPIEHKIYVPGNHSIAVAEGLIKTYDFYGVHFLINYDILIDGIRIYGSPYSPLYGNWAYMLNRARIKYVWEMITECDILITHGPPFGILDTATIRDENGGIEFAGCEHLREKVKAIKPAIHCFGHLHDDIDIYNYGERIVDGINYMNCAVSSRDGSMHNGIVKEIVTINNEKHFITRSQ